MPTTRSLGALLVVMSLTLAGAAAMQGTQAGAQGAAPADSASQAWAKIAADNKHEADEVREKIKGRENAPADSVFENIKMFKGVPAGRMVTIMEMGFARS